jgi:hypothetical protein
MTAKKIMHKQKQLRKNSNKKNDEFSTQGNAETQNFDT